MAEKFNYDLNTCEGRAEMIRDESQLLVGKEENNGAHVIIASVQGHGMEVTAYQKNGWTRKIRYNVDGEQVDETYKLTDPIN